MTTTMDVPGPARTTRVIPAVEVDSALLDDARNVSGALTELIRVIQFRDRDRACCYDVSVSQCYALKAVVDAQGLTVNQLAAHLYLDKSTVSRIANGLVEKRYVTRARDDGDGRVVRLVATPAGVALCGLIEGDLVREYAELLSDFDPEIRSAITTLVARLGRSFANRVDASGGSCCVVRA